MKIKFKDAVQIISGGTPKTSIPEYWNGDIGWLSVADFGNKNKYVETTEKTITQKGLENSSTKLLATNDIILSARGTVGAMAMLKCPLAFNQSCFGLRTNTDLLDQDYLFYYLKNYMKMLKVKKQGSVFDTINLSTFDLIDLDLPTVENQEKVANLLSDIDNKIELNNDTIFELESLVKTIYDYWFLQFEFPNEDGKPYKSSGGKMVWNEELKREIPEKWSVKRYSDIANTTTGKEDANFATENGKYAYFTCGSNILKCDEYKFDGKAILIAGNGDFNVKYYDGKFNAYQRTYVLMPDEKYIGILYQASKRKIECFKKGSNGSIVKFITKGDIDNIELTIPDDDKLFDPFNSILNFIHHNKIENFKLASLRDFLLPMLMNGQVSFKEKL